jgi:aryl-alcohol dehydrogenase-like predicted oxidoreductase
MNFGLQSSDEDSFALMAKALELVIKFFDTCTGYFVHPLGFVGRTVSFSYL